MIDAQFDLLVVGEFPVIVLLSGMDALDRCGAAKQLLSWMDSRHIRSYGSILPSDKEIDRPRMWRFWRVLPPKGKIGVFLNAWYEVPLRDYFLERIGRARFRARVEEIVRFERMLADEGTLFLKVLFLTSQEQNIANAKQALKDAKRGSKSHTAAWKLSGGEAEIAEVFLKRRDDAMAIVEEFLNTTSTDHAPWIALSSADRHYRDLTISRMLRDGIRTRLEGDRPAASNTGTSAMIVCDELNLLNALDLGKSLPPRDYKRRFKKEQRHLTTLTLGKKFEKRALVVVFEGNDTASKGGAIRRVVQALDPRMMRVIPIAAPSDEERAQPYLWRFWRHIARQGHVTTFDRSWYRRVLVKQVEGLVPDGDWMRAYSEIRSFEAELQDYGIIVVKFWLSIDEQEQLRRFQEREKVGYKRHKITDEDWRNRGNWSAYRQAVHDMIERTSTR